MLEYWCSNGQDGNWKDVIHTSFDKFQRKVLEIALLCCGPEIYISMLDNDSQGHKLEMIVMWSIKFWPEPWLMITSTFNFIFGEICKSNIRCWISVNKWVYYSIVYLDLCSQLTQSVEFSEEGGRLEVDEREHDEDEEERHGGELAPDLVKLAVAGVAHPLLLLVGEIVSQAHGVSNI